MPLCVVTPIKEEFQHLAGFFENQDQGWKEKATGRMKYRDYPGLGLLLACGGLGKAQYGLQVQHLLDSVSGISGVICAGAAGVLQNGLRPGEIVVATESVEHDCVYKFAPRGLPRFRGDRHLLERISQNAASLPFKVHFGPVASGDEDVVDRKRAETIRARTGALAVAWEGAGGARACQFSDVPYLELRGLSDGADPLALVSFLFHLGKVMERLGKLILIARG